jgi:hypothetical protein
MAEPKFESEPEFVEAENQAAAAQAFWEHSLDLPDEQCTFEVPAGTIMKSHETGKYVETKVALSMSVDERGNTNYDNQRRASSAGGTFWIKGKFSSIKS